MDKTTQRLDKYLSHLGLASRRSIKKLLKEEMLTVNGDRVRESGTRIDPVKDDIRLNGEKILPPKMQYYILNKPKGIISTTSDERGRQDVTSFIPTRHRIYPVGRLDKDTTGLILLTNDGELTHKLIHPRYHVPKVYRLTIEGRMEKEQINAFQKGVILDDGITSPAEVKIIDDSYQKSLIEVTLHEGKNRQIRRMCEIVGMNLLELERIKFGPISIGQLKSGKYRELSDKEVEQLRQAANKAMSSEK